MSPRGRRGGGARSEDDRQRARLEREQRRAQREGRPVPRSIDDLPVAEPTLDPEAHGVTGFFPAGPPADPGAPASGTSGSAGRGAPGPGDHGAPSDPAAPAPARPDPTGPGRPDGPDPATSSGADHGADDPGASDAPGPRRDRLARLRAGTAPAADPSQDPTVRGAGAEDARAPSADPRPERLWSEDADRARPPADAPGRSRSTADDPSSDAPRSGSGRPWWATAAAGAAPPPPPASRAAPDAPGAGPARPSAARDAAPTPRRPDPSAPDPGDHGAIRAPGTVDPTPGARGRHPDGTPADPRGRSAAAGGARPPAAGARRPAAAPRARPPADAPRGTPRRTDDWFGGEQTEDTGGQQQAAAAEPALVPLRPAGPARPSGTAPATVHTRTAPARRGVSRIAALLVLVPFFVVIAAGVFFFQPFKGDGEGEVRVRIPPGSSVDDIGKLLKERGVVSNALAFAVRARISGDGANLKAGTLRLKRDMSYGAALTALQQDPLPPSVIRVAIPEGLSRSETASSIKKAGVTGSYLTASSKAPGFDPTDFGRPRARSGLEGFLFPATYELQRGGATARNLVDEQLKLFRTSFAKVSMRRARRAKLSPYDVLIVASMIEREVRVPSERKLVAAVIWNRLEQDIALGIDATTRYAVKNWTRPLKQSEIDRDTPYDTRRKKGLPPTPIGSPGLSAMRAAANPANAKFLYYVVKPCSDGRHNFASTDAEFQKDVATYQAAQRRAGGDPSPSDAKGCPAG